MQLPGGLIENGMRRRNCVFRPLTGALELALAEVGEDAPSAPQAVTRALSLALASLADAAASPARVAALCVADRQFLMRELERHLGFSGGWFAAQCTQCAATFDFHLDYAELPVREAGAAYPRARVPHDGKVLSFRLPTGADQEILAELPEAEAPAWLLRQLAEGSADRLAPDPELIGAVEAALDAVAPAIVLKVSAGCPQCGGNNEVDLAPYRLLARASDPLLREVHQIAGHYHWSEAEILALPRARRRHYLQLIDRSRGVSGESAAWA